jgi:hypothetical protein
VGNDRRRFLEFLGIKPRIRPKITVKLIKNDAKVSSILGSRANDDDDRLLVGNKSIFVSERHN